MAITVEQKFDSGETSDESTDLLYIIRGTDDGEAAKEALRAAAPVIHNGMIRGNCGVEWLGLTEWLGQAPYKPKEKKPKEPLQTGESSYSFDTGGGTQHITQAPFPASTKSYVPAGKQAQNFQGAIGVGGDGDTLTVEGVDITVPVFTFSETHCLSDSLVTDEYIQILVDATGKLNEENYKGYEWGEVLFLGASGAQRGGGDWEITFRFAVSRHRRNFSVGDINIDIKRGWSYMWVSYATRLSVSRLVKQPVQVEIVQVYFYYSMANLLI